MKRALLTLAAIVTLIVIALLAAPFFIPVETYKTQIAQAVREATGRELTIAGDMRLSLLPRLAVEAEDVSFANAPGAAAAQMAGLRKLQVQLQVWPLLSGKVKVDSFVLVQPVIYLEVGKDGRANWNFGDAARPTKDTPGAPPTTDTTGAPPTVGTTGASGKSNAVSVAMTQLSVGDVRLEDGLLRYTDARTGETIEVSAVNMRLSLPDLDSLASAVGSLVWNGQRLSLDAKSDSLRGLMSGTPTPVSLGLESNVVTLTYLGTVTKAAAPRLDGQIALAVPSIRELAAWAGSPIDAAGDGLGPLKIEGTLAATPKTIAFTDAQIVLDEIDAQGELIADLGGKTPHLTGRLDVDRIDANIYLPPPAESGTGGLTTAPATDPQAAPAEWSDAPLDFSGLRAVNVDFALSVGEILVQAVTIDRSALTLSLQNGLLTLDLHELDLYGGSGKGKLTVDGRGKIPAVEKTFSLTAIQARPLLTDAAGFDELEGTGTLNVSVAAKGGSQREMVQALNGSGAVKFVDGSVGGINLAAMVRNVGSAFLDAAAGKSQKTDFAELSGTFKIENGILRNDDLSLLNPLLRVAGAGTANIVERTVNYRVEPKFVSSLEGQGTSEQAAGVAVPVLIQGPWHDLTYRPDLAGLVSDIAKDPAKAVQGAKDALQQLKGGAGGLLGTGGANSPAQSEDGGGDAPLKTLKKLFGN